MQFRRFFADFSKIKIVASENELSVMRTRMSKLNTSVLLCCGSMGVLGFLVFLIGRSQDKVEKSLQETRIGVDALSSAVEQRLKSLEKRLADLEK